MKQRGRENSEPVAQGVDSFYKKRKSAWIVTKLFSESEVCRREWKLMEERNGAPLGNGTGLLSEEGAVSSLQLRQELCVSRRNRQSLHPFLSPLKACAIGSL